MPGTTTNAIAMDFCTTPLPQSGGNVLALVPTTSAISVSAPDGFIPPAIGVLTVDV